MEIFGTCNSEKSDHQVVINSSDLMYDKEVAACFAQVGIEQQKEYEVIDLSLLRKILDGFKQLFLTKFETHKTALLHPEEDRSSQRFKLAYREIYLSTVDQTGYVYFANSAHKQLEWLDGYIATLSAAVEKKQQGFIYILPSEIDQKARSIMGAIRRMGDFSLASFERVIGTFGEEALGVLQAHHLLQEKEGKMTYTHKCLVYYFDDLL